MRTKADDGSMHSSQMAASQHNMKPAKAMPSDGGDDQQQGDDIESDPEAMQAIDMLKQKGYTPDQVAQAMTDDGGDQMQGGGEATAAAPMQIPGMSS